MNLPNVLVKTCFLTLLSTHAFAYQPDENRWNGFYVGANMGSAQNQIKTRTAVAPGGTYFDYVTDAPQIAAAGDYRLSKWKFSGGMFAGYDQLFDNILTGVVASITRVSINNSVATGDVFFTDPNVRFVVGHLVKNHWQETLRLKLGVVQNAWSGYLTGGAAIAHIQYASSYNDNNAQPGSGLPGGGGTGTTTKTKLGWSLGAGGEYLLTDVLSINVEYLYSDLGKVTTDYILIPTPTLSEFSAAFNNKVNLVSQSILVGIIYRP